MSRATIAAFLFVLSAASPAAGQNAPAGAYDVGQLVLPLELTQGVVTDRGDPLPFTVSGRLHPMIVLESHGRWKAGASLAATYRNPGWEFLAGPRLSFQAIEVKPADIEGLGIEFGLEGLFGTTGGDEVAVEAVANLDGLFRLGVRAARDYSRGQYRLEGVIGTDLLSWSRSAPEDP